MNTLVSSAREARVQSLSRPSTWRYSESSQGAFRPASFCQRWPPLPWVRVGDVCCFVDAVWGLRVCTEILTPTCVKNCCRACLQGVCPAGVDNIQQTIAKRKHHKHHKLQITFNKQDSNCHKRDSTFNNSKREANPQTSVILESRGWWFLASSFAEGGCRVCGM